MKHVEELVVYDQPEPCPYLPDRDAHLPLRYPLSKLDGQQFAAYLAAGNRRAGAMMYRPECRVCRACEALRIDVGRFRISRSQRRVKRRGQQVLVVEVGPVIVDQQRVEMFNRHRNERGLRGQDGDVDRDGYEGFLADSCGDTFEIRYRKVGRLVGVAVCDLAADALSAVYCFFDPDESRLSVGVYSVLTQIELCRKWNFRYLYLGYYVAESPRMRYKANYLPHERLIDGEWREFTTTTTR